MFPALARCVMLVGVVTASVLTVSSVGHAAPAPVVGQPPVAVDDVVTTVAGKAVDIRPLDNDSDPEDGPLTLRSAKLQSVSATSATLTVSAGVVRIVPKATFTGKLSASYVVADEDDMTTEGAITVTVTAPPNRPPKTSPDKATVVAGGSVAVKPLANDTDPDKDTLKLVSAATSNKSAGSGTVASGNRVIIKASSKFTGKFSVRYLVDDSHGARAEGTIAVTVTPKPVNHAPVAHSDSYTVLTGSTKAITVLGNDTDRDGDRIRLSSVGKASLGTARRSGSKILFIAPNTPGKATVKYVIRDSHDAHDSAVLTIVVKARPFPKPTKSNVEAALSRLGMPVGAVDGQYDGATRRAVCAWRTITGRPADRDLPTSAEAKAIIRTKGLPKARAIMVTGITVSITCQAAFWVGKNRQYKRVMAACSGMPGYQTRLGTFRVFRSFTTWRWSTIYPEARMYKPLQFSGGQALHGSATDRLVKTVPASHGCVRMLHRDIDALHRGGAGLGTKVRVIGVWKG